MTAKQFTDLLKKWGIQTEDNSRNGVKWYDHNRNHKGNWGPVNGIGNHHTGASDNRTGADVLWNGVSNLPGPLCHAGIRQNGKVLLNGWGRTNHFGLGDPTVFRHVLNEDYTGVLRPRIAEVDGNSHFYGFEWMYNGKENPETAYPKLWHTAVRLNAAINTWHGWTFKSSIGHGEWQPGKWDPGFSSGRMLNMAHFRDCVNQAMHEGPNPQGVIYTVEKGDTLSSIAEVYHTTVSKLVELNHLKDPDELSIGQKLRVR